MATIKRNKKSNFEEMYKGFQDLSNQSGIDFDKIIEFFERSLVISFNKEYKIQDIDQKPTIKVIFDEQKSKLNIVRVYTVVPTDDDVNDFDNEITLEDAKKIDKNAEVGQEINEELDVDSWHTASLNQVKQSFCQEFIKEKNNILRDTLESKNNEIVRAKVLRIDARNNLYCELVGLRTEALLHFGEQLKNDNFSVGQEFFAYIYKIENLDKTSKAKADVRVYISRTRKELVERVLSREVPEIRDGVVSIVSIARQPGVATKVSVKSNDPNVNPVTACIGDKAQRINQIKKEIGGELVEIVQYYDDETKYILEALKPAIIKEFRFESLSKQFEGTVETKAALRIALGKSNASLASKLTGWKIKINCLEDKNNENDIKEEE